MTERAERRGPWMLLAAVVLFLLVLGVSRLADFGIVPGGEFGASDAERTEVRLEVTTVSDSGERRPLGREIEPGDRLELVYGPTRYPYVWVLAIDSRGRARPLIDGRLTRANGETLSVRPPEEQFVLMCLFSAVPRTLEQIQASLDEDVRLPGLRFAWRIEIRQRV